MSRRILIIGANGQIGTELATALAHNNTLIHLGLRGNSIRSDGCEALAATISVNKVRLRYATSGTAFVGQCFLPSAFGVPLMCQCRP